MSAAAASAAALSRACSFTVASPAALPSPPTHALRDATAWITVDERYILSAFFIATSFSARPDRRVIRLELLYFPNDRSAAAFNIVLHGPTVD